MIAGLEQELGDKMVAYPQEHQLLDWEKVREMSKGINFGSHTVNHVVLPLENETVIQNELEVSKSELERQLGKKVISFAYPNGEFDAKIKAAASRAGYKVAVTTKPGMNRAGAVVIASAGVIFICVQASDRIIGMDVVGEEPGLKSVASTAGRPSRSWRARLGSGSSRARRRTPAAAPA